MKKLALVICCLAVAVPLAGAKRGKKPGKQDVNPERDAALAAWQTSRELGNAFANEAVDSYTADAVLVTERSSPGEEPKRLEIPVATLRPQWAQLMFIAKIADDRDTYADVSIVEAEGGWLVSATRTSISKCTTDPKYTALLVDDGGTWRIKTETTATSAASQCAPDPEAARGVIRRSIEAMGPLLPGMLDADTRLEALEADGLTYINRATLVNLGVSDITPGIEAAFLPMLVKQTCAGPTTKVLLHHGGAVKYVYVTNDGERTLEYVVTGADCDH